MDVTLITGCKVNGHAPTSTLVLHFESGGQQEAFGLGADVARSLVGQLVRTVVNAPLPVLEQLSDCFEPRNLEAGVHGLTPVLRYDLAGVRLASSLDLEAARALHEQLGKVIAHLESTDGASGH